MAVPFRRTSSKAKKERQGPSKFKFSKQALRKLIKCSNCQALKKPHFICSSCSTYRSLKF